MDVPPELQDNVDLSVQELLLAASNHDIASLRSLLREHGRLVNEQDSETGFSALHAAVAACEGGDEEEEKTVNGQSSEANGTLPDSESAAPLDKAKATVQWLLQNGAIWNLLDKNGETPGCIAYRLHLTDLYKIFVDAGTRAEMLLSRLEEYEELNDEDEEDEDEGVNEQVLVTDASSNHEVTNATDNSSAETPNDHEDPAASNEAFLNSELTFRPTALLDRDANGVMMDWETGIMEKTADLLLQSEGLAVLNIGHGMGIIDSALQKKKPKAHHIIEAHPAVIERLKAEGWLDRPGVHVHEGRWQDVVPSLLNDGVLFDAVFYDTFAEDYRAFKTLFEEYMIGLLDDSGRWSFFNGLGADRQISYDVYKNIMSMDLQEAGYEIDWTTIDIPDLKREEVWVGTKRPYWTLAEYHLPICSFSS